MTPAGGGAGAGGSGEPRPFVVFDIDGVLADVRHRLHLVEGRRKDWDAFFAAAPADPPLPDGVQLAQGLADASRIAYVTGRPQRYRRDTELWLRQHGLPRGELLMRAEGDRRPARQVKPQLLARLAQKGPIAAVVDDDPAVCAALREAGYPVQEARWMPASPTLRVAQEREGRT